MLKIKIFLFSVLTIIIIQLSATVYAQESIILGNISWAFVRLDGRELFEVTAPVVDGVTNSAIQRATIIEQRLYNLIDNSNIKKIKITDKLINNERVIVANDGQNYFNYSLVTITQLDQQFYGQNITQIAQNWINQIQRHLSLGFEERSAEYIQTQIPIVISALLIMLALSLSIIELQKRLYNFGKVLLTRYHQSQIRSALDYTNRVIESVIPPFLQLPEFRLLITNYMQQNINWLLRYTLQWTQIAIWLIGISFILSRFPYTREWSGWLIGTPIYLYLIGLSTTLTNKIGDLIIDWGLKYLAQGETNTKRSMSRWLTFSQIFKGLKTVIIIAIGLILSLSVLGISVTPLLAGAGIITFAITWSSESLIKDIINGMFILIEDHFMVGDEVKIGDVEGIVENLNLRMTQLRSVEGQLITIPNSSITRVINKSRDWNRLIFKITVPCNLASDQIVSIIQSVANELQQLDEYKEALEESPQVLGIEQLANIGIVVQVWIKTKPQQQGLISYEFRHRLKLAFDTLGIIVMIT